MKEPKDTDRHELSPSVGNYGSDDHTHETRDTELQDEQDGAESGMDQISKNGDVTEMTLDEIIEQIGLRRFHGKLTILCGLLYAMDAMEVMLLAVVTPEIDCDWNIGKIGEALIGMVTFIGMALGCFFYGTVGDRYGRRSTVLHTLCSILFYGLLSAAAPNFPMLVLLRFLTGFSLGGMFQCFTYMIEFVPKWWRVQGTLIMALFWSLGGIMVVVFGILFMKMAGWRGYLVAAAVPQLLVTITFWAWAPETLHYLLITDRQEELHKVIMRIAGSDKSKQLPTKFRIVQRKTKGEKEGKAKTKEQKSLPERGRLKDLCAPGFRLVSALWFTVCPLGHFLYYGIVLSSPGIIAGGTLCKEDLIQKRFRETAHQACSLECVRLDMSGYLRLLWTSLAELPGTIVVAGVTLFLGRKYPLAATNAIVTLVTGLFLVCGTPAITVVLLMIARAAGQAASWLAHLYFTETYPTCLRASACGYIKGTDRVAAAITPFVAQALMSVSPKTAVLIYVAVGVVCTVCCLLFPYDTKDMELSESMNSGETAADTK